MSKASSERLQHVLVAVRQGAVGLAQRLAPFNYLLGFEDVDPFGSSTGGASAAGAGFGAGESAARAVVRAAAQDVDVGVHLACGLAVRGGLCVLCMTGALALRALSGDGLWLCVPSSLMLCRC